MTFRELESTHLSDGSLVTLTKAGRAYRVMKSSPKLFEVPEITGGLNKQQAYNLYADILKADVLELAE